MNIPITPELDPRQALLQINTRDRAEIALKIGLDILAGQELTDSDINKLASLAEEFLQLNGTQCPQCQQWS